MLMVNENNKYNLVKRISSIMLHQHLPELNEKSSNEAKTVCSIFKYVAFIAVAISTVAVCALFVKFSLLPGESYGNHSLLPCKENLPCAMEKCPIAQEKGEVYIGVNIELKPLISNSNNSIKEVEHSKQNWSKESIPAKKVLLKHKPLNSHVFQSLTTPQPNVETISLITTPPLREIIKPNMNNSKKEEVKLVNTVEKNNTSKIETEDKSFLNPLDVMFPFYSYQNDPNKTDQKNLDQIKSDSNLPSFKLDPIQRGPIGFINVFLKPNNVKEIDNETADVSSDYEDSKMDDSKETVHWPFLHPFFDSEEIALDPINSLFKPINSNETELFPFHKSINNIFKLPLFDSFFDSDEMGDEIEDSFSLFDKFDHNDKELETNKESDSSNEDNDSDNSDDFNDKMFPTLSNLF